MTHFLQAAALRYAAAGWPVFLLSKTKRPLALCKPCQKLKDERADHDPQACPCLTCHGFYAATLNPRRVRAMFVEAPSGLLAIRTGAASGLVVVDVDPSHGGTASLATLVERGLTPPTRFVRTGSGGLHLYYRHPGPHMRIPCSAGVLGPGIDVRGDGGYAVAAPSTHPVTRRPYVWADEDQAVTEMAPALLTACTTPPEPRPATDRRTPTYPHASYTGARTISSPDRLLSALLETVRAAPPGRRRTTLYGCARGAARIAATGAITPATARTALLDACQQARWDINPGTHAAIAGGFADEGVSL